MGAEDADVADEEERHPPEQHPPSSPWEMFYDESYDPPVPWWLDSTTGESTWECPTTRIPADPGDFLLLLRQEDVAISESDRRQQHRQLAVVVEPDDAAAAAAAAPSPWVRQWSEEHQVTKKNKVARYK